MSMASRKRSRTPDWKIVFDDAESIRSMVAAVGPVLQSRITFKVERKDGRNFLMVDGNDLGFVCCVSARLQLEDVTFPLKEDDAGDLQFEFCVETEKMAMALDVPMHRDLSLSLAGFDATADVEVTFFDADHGTHQAKSVLKTFEHDGSNPLKAMEFDITVELDLFCFKDVIKKARKAASSDNVRIAIFLATVGQTKLSVVRFEAAGDTFEHRQEFCQEVIMDEDSSIRVRVATDGTHSAFDLDDEEPVFEECFPTEKIDAFLKHVPHRMIFGRIKKGLPLMLHYNINGSDDDSSYVRFLVAPVNDDDCN